MLEVGAFHPAWGEIHLGPENALAALGLLGGGPFLPVHWGTFNLAIHAWDEPPETLVQLAPRQDVQLVMPLLGEPVEPSRVERVDPWWRAVTAVERISSPGGRRRRRTSPPALSLRTADRESTVAWPARMGFETATRATSIVAGDAPAAARAVTATLTPIAIAEHAHQIVVSRD